MLKSPTIVGRQGWDVQGVEGSAYGEESLTQGLKLLENPGGGSRACSLFLLTNQKTLEMSPELFETTWLKLSLASPSMSLF